MDYLFSLVQSLSATEKRYFTRLSTLQTQSSVNQYAKLFNKLCKVKKYNEKEIKQEFNAIHFPQLKQTLYKKILQALRMFHASEHFENEPNIHLTNSKILLSKGLVDEAKKEFNRAEKNAIASNLPFEKAMLFRDKNFQNTRISTAHEIQERLSQHDEFWGNHIKQLENELKYEKLFLEVELLNKQFEATRNSLEKRNISDFLQNFLLINEKSAETAYSKILFHFIKGLAYYLNSDFNYCEKYMLLSAELLENNPSYISQKEDIYIRTLANLCLVQLYQKSSKFEESILRLEKFKPSFPHIIDYKNYLVFVLQLMKLNMHLEYTLAVELIETTKDFTEKIENQIIENQEISQEKVYSIFQKVTAYLGNNQRKEAKKLLSDFIQKKSYAMKEDAFILARVLLLFIHFESKDNQLIESEMRSIQRFLHGRNKLYLFEKQILKFISNMLDATTLSERKVIFSQLKNDMMSLKSMDLEKNAFIYFDFSNWINSFDETAIIQEKTV
ncbi:MAG: hypothetical protein HYR91_05465 [Flavobacteriia bacterium]|nr:hypothetical protein [Flavobacteriia bacterium]